MKHDDVTGAPSSCFMSSCSAAYNRGMNTVEFGRTGFRVSRLGFGAAPIGFLGTERDRVGVILNTLLDNGVNLIDTAASYPGAEEVIRQTVGHRRGEFVLVSKCGQKVGHVPGTAWSAELITQTVEASLKRLGTDVIDVMLLHSCDLATLRKGEALGALVKAREAGKIRFAGYSGDNEAGAYAAGLADIAVIETSVSFVDQNNIDVVLPVTVEKNVGVLAKRPIGNSCWRDLSEFKGIYPGYVKPYIERFGKMGMTPESVGFDGDWAELALRFTLSLAGMHTAIIGTTNPENARANILAAERGALPVEVVGRIRLAGP